MKFFRNIASAFVLLCGVLASSTALAATETNVSSGLTIKGPGLAVHGYDVVAYFTDGQPTVGHSKYSIVHKDATYRFASKQHLNAFNKNPERYVPQYGGYCAYGVSVGAKFDGDPHLWRIVDRKLYLNLNDDIQQTWKKDIPGNITKADQLWIKIASKNPEELS